MSAHSRLRRTFVILLFIVSSGLAHAQFSARVQAIHNSADPELAVIDFYVADQLILDDVAFRTASPYLDVPAFIPLTGGIAPGNSTGPGDVFFEFTFTLGLNQTYQFILTGVRDPGLFLPNPDGRDISLNVLVNEDAREVGSDPDRVDVNVIHGSPDVSALDVGATLIITGGRRAGVTPLADAIRFSDSSDYVTIEPSNVLTVDGLEGPFPAWFWATEMYAFGEAMTVLISGFSDPGQNQNGAEYAPLLVLADGSAIVLGPVTSASEDGASNPTSFKLHGNYPNPFNLSTTIAFDLATPAFVSLDVFDVFGRKVMATGEESFPAGTGHAFYLDVGSLPSGAYIYRMIAGLNGSTLVQTERMTLIR